MRWLDYPFYRFLGCLILGILLAFYTDAAVKLWWVLGLFTLLVLVLTYFIRPFSITAKTIFTLSSLLFFIALGSILMSIKQEVKSVHHFIYSTDKQSNQLLVLQLREQLSSNQYNHRFYAEVKRVDSSVTTGKVLVLFKTADSVKYVAGDELIVYDDIKDASDSRNPGDFNYKEYLESIDVYGQVYVDQPKILQVTQNSSSLPWYINSRNDLLAALQSSNLSPNSRAMVEALVLGQRQNVDPTITQSFRDAGVIHILALSGLHVGIILLILQFSLRWMERSTYGKIVQTILIIVLLWCFALLTGMSPSILRAVTMFSFVAIGMSLNRKRSVFHSLTISAFFLLVYDRRLLFQVGFQLSYTAVLAIVLIQPLLMRLLPRIKYKLLRKLWQIATVTVAAQIGVAPLSIFYFHQIPLAFLLGNLVLLLLLPFILGASILFITLLKTGLPTNWLGVVLNYVFENLIAFVGYISNFKSLVLKDVYLKSWEVLFIYIAMIALVLFVAPMILKSRRERFKLTRANYGLHMALIAIIGLVIVSMSNLLRKQNNFLILHQSRASAIGISNTANLKLLIDFSTMDENRKAQSISRLKQIELYRDTRLVVEDIPSIIKFENKELIIIDESAVYVKDYIKNPIVLLSNSPKINLDRLISDLKPQMIVTDGSNYRNFVDRWKLTCEQRNIKFVNTYDAGAVDLLDY